MRMLSKVAMMIGVLAGPIALGAPSGAPLQVAGLGDMEKLTKDEAVPASPHFWDAAAKRLKLHGGRNEVVAAQLMFTAAEDVAGVNVEVGDLKGAAGSIPADPNVQLFLELYQFVANGSYSWGPPSAVLPSKKWYPDALAPFNDPYGPERKPVASPFTIAVSNGPNQGVWIDVYIPKSAAPGRYEAPIRVTAAGTAVWTGTLDLTVHRFTLPDEQHVDAMGEMYCVLYGMHDAAFRKAGVDKWWAVAKRYHQMAHQHRFVVLEREDAVNIWPDTNAYVRTYGTVLDGTLFTKAEGYYGPGEGAGPAFWRAPYVQAFNGEVPRFTDIQLQRYADTASRFWAFFKQRGWDKKRCVAFITDEWKISAQAVADERRLQEAIDAGAGGPGRISLIWPSHTDAATLTADPALDLRGIVRWWAPNGSACNPAFYAERMKAGETVWFYHSGHPCIGVHCVNASGIELRTWGTICWRYGITGSWWWAMDYPNPAAPYAKPQYKDGDTRWGNGVAFYPGARLKDVGLPNIDGPVASLRMKAYRRGLQDYEYGWLLKQAGKGALADERIRQVIPKALTEASGTSLNAAEGNKSATSEQRGGAVSARGGANGPPWSTDANDWYRMREDLAAALGAR